MSLTTASIRLADGLQTVELLWQETRAGWDDSVSRDFETNHWLPLKTQVEVTLQALDRLGPILARAQRECS